MLLIERELYKLSFTKTVLISTVSPIFSFTNAGFTGIAL